MNCERCQTELEDFLYGELAESQTAAVRAHLADCADCVQARATLEREHEIFAQYYEQTALEPAPEMWQTIQARIHTEATAPAAAPEKAGFIAGILAWLSGAAVVRQVALALVLVVVSVMATTYYLKSQQSNDPRLARLKPSPTVTVAPTPGVTPEQSQVAPPTPLAKDLAKHNAPVQNAPRTPLKPQPKFSETQLIQNQIARAEREYQGALKLLDRVIARHRDNFAPGLLKRYESSLALIDNSIAESRRALRERPEDAASGQFLLAAYAKKLELMQEIATQAGQ
ncbi:MAG: zf-HC2 domain-containing protein [Acidobacteria bacterium]|nr:zf-HC2 domain-containing protein [Acidobacteriota bacterium]MBI3426478.1 zf-HC2 domain-containing protein [Acidobacteriota bacterium]